ncbi:MAG: cation transporter [Candidatus Obscuribacterales bacterium]|nr:cation transporter [Candidatus Obscuribacterales bacterium]
MKEEKEKQDKVTRLKEARTVFVQTLGLNLLVSFSKLGIGISTSTLSMIADGFHSLLDASSNILGIIGLTISSKPADEGHPYGHRKFEALAAIGISFLMFFACFEVISEVVKRIMSQGGAPESTPASYLVMVATIIINILVSRYESKKGAELHSRLLEADSKHTLSDVFVSIGVIVSLLAVNFKFYFVDVVASLLIVLVIFKAGYEIIQAHLGILVDAAALEPEEVKKLVLKVPGVLDCHKIRSRGLDDHIFIDLHVQVRGHITVEEGHKIAYQVEDLLMKEIGGVEDVMVHIEEDRS